MSMNLGEQTGRTGQPRRTGQLEWRELTGRAGLGQLERLGLIVQRELPWKGTRVHG
jgi:hypothetical protein